MSRHEIRDLRAHEEYAACVRLQREVWGAGFTDIVPPPILKVTQRLGGVAAGAFTPGGELEGFVFGMTGVEGGRLVHWSDLLAVAPSARSQGLGRRLKEYQRDKVAAFGVESIYWSYDPLLAPNAHLNLEIIGAVVREYAVDLYGPAESSELHRGLGSDRLIVEWTTSRPARRPAPPAAHIHRLVRYADGTPLLQPLPDPPPDWILIEIPAEIGLIQKQDVALAGRWRSVTRDAFLTALSRGYRVMAFRRAGGDAAPAYVLGRFQDSGFRGQGSGVRGSTLITGDLSADVR